MIDPLDGTKGFLNKTNNFTVNIALIENCKPTLGVIYSPMSGELFYTSTSLESFKYNFLTKNRKVKLSGQLIRRDKIILITSENNFSERESKVFKDNLEHDVLKSVRQLNFASLQRERQMFIQDLAELWSGILQRAMQYSNMREAHL